VLQTGSNPHGLVAADVNGDGVMDLVVSTRSSFELGVFLGDGKGSFNALPPLRTGQDVIALAAEDFDRDGKVDLALVSASHNAVVMLRGDGKGGFSPFAEAGPPKP
jgi:hypothetical protein